MLAPPSHEDDLNRFYGLVRELERGLRRKREIEDVRTYSDWPERGVYLLFENGELRSSIQNSDGQAQMRVTRIGTHAIKSGAQSTLLGRLKAHRGNGSGGGNHRGSILREHVGNALLNSPDCRLDVPTWNKDISSRDRPQEEKELESRVSAYVGKMQVLWIRVDDEPSRTCDRAFLEENMIALLSQNSKAVDPPSRSWLGNYSPEPVIRSTGLWNVRSVGREYHHEFLDILNVYVEITIGRRQSSGLSLAPKGWILRR
jgi:hypothetical protein